MAYRDIILAEASLQSYWNLNEAAGNAIDQKDAIAGTYTGGIRQVAGLIASSSDTAFSVDRTLSEFVSYGDNYGMVGTVSFSLEWWYKPAGDIDPSGNVLFNKLAAGALGGWRVDYYPAGVNARRVDSAGAADASPNSQVLVNGSTYHFVVTYDGATLRLYVNGIERGSGTASTRSIPAHANPLRLCAFSGGGSGSTGTFDEPAIYNAALSASAVQAHFDAAGTALFLPARRRGH